MCGVDKGAQAQLLLVPIVGIGQLVDRLEGRRSLVLGDERGEFRESAGASLVLMWKPCCCGLGDVRE